MADNEVKKICAELGITQKELAERIGVAEQTIYNWSGGKEIPIWALKSFSMLRELRENKEIVDTAQRLLDLLRKKI